MSIFAPSRVVTIASKLTAANQSVTLISASSVSLAGESFPYDCEIYSLKATGFIRELERVWIPTDNPSDHSSTREFKAAQFEAGPKIGVQMLLVNNETTELFWLGQPIPFFNNGGLFEVNISQALSELVKYELQVGFSIKAQTTDLGHGLLTSNDQIHFSGHARRSAEFLQDSQETIYTVS